MKADIFYNQDTHETVLTLRAESNAEGAALKLLAPRLGFEVSDLLGSPTTAERRVDPRSS